MKKKRKGKYKRQKGVSTVVATFLVILLSLVAVAVIWVVIKKAISTELEGTEISTRFFNERFEIRDVEESIGNPLVLTVMVRKNSGTLGVEANQSEQQQETVAVDLVSVNDLSGSMRECRNTNDTCNTETECANALGGGWNSGELLCHSIDSDKLGRCATSCGGDLDDKLTATQGSNVELVSTLLVEPVDSKHRVGLVGYNNLIRTSTAMTGKDGVSDLTTEINSWEAIQGTCICCGINEAKNKLSLSSLDETPKYMIVMSDGIATVNCGGTPKQDAINAACNANATLNDLTIHTVGLGVNVDAPTLQAIADCANGEYFFASDVSNLIEIYQEISTDILKKYEIQEGLSILRLRFYNEDSSVVTRDVTVPRPLETTIESINLTGDITGKIIKVELYPIIISNGEEIIGPILDTWKY